MKIGLFGLPGAGKGTQSERVAGHFSIPHISTGDMFRELQKGATELAREIKAITSSGGLISDDMVTKLTFERLKSDDCRSGFVLDGYPRTLAQSEALQSSPFALDGLFFIDVDREEIVQRLCGRRVCESCKAIFGVDDLKKFDSCPNDGGPLVQREDDKAESVSRRLALFEKNFRPVLDFYSNRSLLFRVDGRGSVARVFNNLLNSIEAHCK